MYQEEGVVTIMYQEEGVVKNVPGGGCGKECTRRRVW